MPIPTSHRTTQMCMHLIRLKQQTLWATRYNFRRFGRWWYSKIPADWLGFSSRDGHIVRAGQADHGRKRLNHECLVGSRPPSTPASLWTTAQTHCERGWDRTHSGTFISPFGTPVRIISPTINSTPLLRVFFGGRPHSNDFLLPGNAMLRLPVLCCNTPRSSSSDNYPVSPTATQLRRLF